MGYNLTHLRVEKRLNFNLQAEIPAQKARFEGQDACKDSLHQAAGGEMGMLAYLGLRPDVDGEHRIPPDRRGGRETAGIWGNLMLISPVRAHCPKPTQRGKGWT